MNRNDGVLWDIDAVNDNNDDLIQEAARRSSRHRTLTEKGKAEQLRVLKSRLTSVSSSLTKKRNELSRLLLSSSSENLHIVKLSFTEFNYLCQKYYDCYSQYYDEIEFQELRDSEQSRHVQKERYNIQFRNEVEQWISRMENILSDQLDSASGKKSTGASKTSSRSTTSIRSAYARERARLAELKAQRSLQNSLLEETKRLECLKLDIEIAKAQAREKVYVEVGAEALGMRANIPDTTSTSYILHDKPAMPDNEYFMPDVKPTMHNVKLSMSDVKPSLFDSKPIETYVHQSQPGVSADNRSSADLNLALSDVTCNDTNNARQGKIHREHVSSYSKKCVNDPETLNPNANTFAPAHSMAPTLQASTPFYIHQQNESILQAHRQMATAMMLPQPKVPKFKGDPTEYSTFIMAFDARIVPHVSNASDQLYYLDQQLEGEPKDLIAGCMFMDPAEGYRQARDLLAREYGDPYKASTAFVNQILTWPPIKFDDYAGLKKLSHFLIKCFHAMKNMSHLTVLNHSVNLQAIVLKLPIHLQNKWRDHVTKKRLHFHQVVDFESLVHFIEFASRSANEPVFGKEAICKSQTQAGYKQGKGPRKDGPKSSSLLTGVESSSPKQIKQRSVSCYFCNGPHDIEACKQFSQKSLDERRAYLRDKKMCYGCFGYNHTAKGCMKKRTCKECGKRHPTILHDSNFNPVSRKLDPKSSARSDVDITDNLKSVSSSCNNTHPEVTRTVLQAILPVLIHQKENNTVVKTYALLDNGSTGCFVTEDLLQELDATSTASSLKLRTMHGSHVVNTHVIENLIVTDLNGDKPVTLPRTFTRQEIPVSHSQIPNPDMLKKWPHLQSMVDKLPEYLPGVDIGILIGSNCPLALQPREVIPTEGDGPFAVLYRQGWTVSGPLEIQCNASDNTFTCNRVMFQEFISAKECLTDAVLTMFEMDFNAKDAGTLPGERGLSREDQKFIDMAKENIKEVNGHFELPLPLREPNTDFLNNREQAEKRVRWQRKKMLQNSEYHEHYTAFMDSLISNGYAYKVPDDELTATPGKLWYLPHHGVYHPKKPSKIRVVFDCSATYKGSSLNDRLLQGPDLTNSLIGVLMKFRAEPIAFMADIEAMFYQVHVPPHQHDFLRFLWWPNGDLNSDLQEYRMSVHIFGAISSPSISSFALKAAADKAEEKYGSSAAATIRGNFYVDDCLNSSSTEEDAVDLVHDLQKSCAEGGFHLTKFTSNSRKVLKSLPTNEHSKEIQTRELNYDGLIVERALGMQWHIDSDMFAFSVNLKTKPLTRRGLLSTMSSLYDPLGIVSPVLLPAKRILQKLCIDKQLGWDDEIPTEDKTAWEKWLNELQHLSTFRLERCVKPADFGVVVSQQLHVYSDASTVGYGCAAYLRLCNSNGDIHTALLMGKSRLAPVKLVTIPRLELTAATVSLHLGQLLMKELENTPDNVTYHTDSTTVLHYIRSEKRRFPVFVANRVKTIRDFSKQAQWRYVESKSNPADVASRGLTALQLLTCKHWFKGPKYLSTPKSEWPVQKPDEEPGLEEIVTASDVSQGNATYETVSKLLNHYSRWYSLNRAVAIYHKLFDFLKSKNKDENAKFNPSLSVQDIATAKEGILRFVQSCHFAKELEILHNLDGSRGRVPKTSPVYKLDPFLDNNGLLRVGGRINKACIPMEMRHPILMPYRCHTTTLIIRDQHFKLGHAGRNHVLSMLREHYWIIKANSAVRNVLIQCVTCRRLRSPVCEQKMANLPSRRVNPAPPFTYTGVDFFGPFVIKEGRKYVKRYGSLFTCLASRAIHIETANSLDTDSFIHALRRFIARRGQVLEIWCDNGTNFTGASRELKKAVAEMDEYRLKSYMLEHNIKWNFNPPYASHMGGIWERMIRTVRKTLSSYLHDFSERLNDESFRTLICEVEAIVNSRPLTTMSDNPDDLRPLSPSHLLIMKTNVSVPPPGVFQKTDVYMRRRWRQIQYLANVFWSRWKKEYLVSLQQRHKWNAQRKNIQVNDVVLIVDDSLPRFQWRMARVISVVTDDNGLVRSATVKTPTSETRRPINKLVLLLSGDE